MTLELHPTKHIVKLNGVHVRVWEGKSSNGTPCFVFVARIAVQEAADTSEFDNYLSRTEAPDITDPVTPPAASYKSLIDEFSQL